MYCYTCGSQITAGLSYCSRCGTRTAGDGGKNPSLTENLASSLSYVGGAGFIAYIFVVVALLRYGALPNQIIPITMIYFAALFGICFLILRQTALLANRDVSPGRTAVPEPPNAAYLRPVTTAQLEEHREPASVTDSTTRTLDELRIGRR